jgi:drug/metabolite transporter (DMT)-like permease
MFIIINSLLYILTNTFSVLGIKLNNYLYNYSNFFISLFFLNLFYPIIFLFYLLYYKNFNNITFYLFKFSLFCSFLYLIENILIYYSINNTPLSFYVIARTCISFFNLFFKKYYHKNQISFYNYIAIICLLLSYLFLLFDMFNDFNINFIIPFFLLLLSGFITSLYSNIYEKNFKNIYNDQFFNSKLFFKFKIFSFLIFNLLSFLILFPFSLFHFHNFSNNFNINLIFFITGFCSQFFNIFRIFLLTFNNIDANKLVAGLDLLRRIFMNLFSYLYFNENFNNLILFSNLFMFLGSFILLFKK